jgi:hypothetical protein
MTGARPRTGRIVDFARGDRNYVHSIDMIRAAPLTAEDKSFRFRFFSVVERPGFWVTADAGNRASAHAELIVDGREGASAYYFVCDEEARVLSRRSDFNFRFDPALFTLEARALSGPLSEGSDIWEQLTEAVRYGGQQLFPDTRWLTVGISGSGQCLAPLAAGTRLHLQLLTPHRQFNSIRFSTSAGGHGTIMTAQRDGDR